MAEKVSLHQNAIGEDIQKWTTMYEKRAKKDRDKYGSLYQLLQSFDQFKREYFAYFENAPRHLRYRALQAISDEWAGLSRIAEQRELTRYENALVEADERANRFLPRNLRDQSEFGSVSFYGKTSTIRRSLYSTVSVVSIPRHLHAGHDDHMAAAHEIGHKVFWHLESPEGLRMGESQLHAQIRDDIGKLIKDPRQSRAHLNLALVWLEEGGADVFGTVAAGRRFGESIIEQILKPQIDGVADLLHNDGDHPLPYLRPLLRANVLERMGKGDDAESLRQAWKSYVRDELGIDEQELYSEPLSWFIAQGQRGDGRPNVETIQLSLRDTETVLLNVVVERLFPLARKAFEEGIEIRALTFEGLRQHVEQLGTSKPGEAFHELLTSLSDEEHVVAQASPHSHVYCDSHWLGDPLHFHQSNGTMILCTS